MYAALDPIPFINRILLGMDARPFTRAIQRVRQLHHDGIVKRVAVGLTIEGEPERFAALFDA